MTSVSVFFTLVLGLTVAQRLAELRIAKRNTSMLLLRGGVEFGASQYWIVVLLHTLFFISLLVEFVLRGRSLPSYWWLLLSVFFLAQAGRVWVLRTMKDRWTTRVIAVPGEKLVREGPFLFLPHPNYMIVAVELLTLPLIFGLYTTAIVFTALNAVVLLAIRLPIERASLRWSQQHET
jgi:methyltransferase